MIASLKAAAAADPAQFLLSGALFTSFLYTFASVSVLKRKQFGRSLCWCPCLEAFLY